MFIINSKKTKKKSLAIKKEVDKLEKKRVSLDQEKGWKLYSSKIRQAFRDVCEDMLKEGKNEVEIRELFTEFGEIFIDDAWRIFFFESGLWENLAIKGFYDSLVLAGKNWDSSLEKLLRGEKVSEGFINGIAGLLSFSSAKAKQKLCTTIKKALEDSENSDESHEKVEKKKTLLRKSLNSTGPIMTMLRHKCIKRLIIEEKIITKIIKVFKREGFFNLINDEVDFALAEEGSIDSVISGSLENKGRQMLGTTNVEIRVIKEK